MKKPIQIVRKDDGEVYEIQPDDTYANVKSKEMGSIMTWKLEHFNSKFFTFIY